MIDQLGLDPLNLSQESLSQRRKELFLELQLSESQTIQINGTEFTKNDIIQNFEELSSEDLSFHVEILKHKELIHFLEHQRLPSKRMSAGSFLPENIHDFEAFKGKVSPFIAFSTNRILGEIIKNGEAHRLLNIKPILQLLENIDFYYAFRKFRHIIDELNADANRSRLSGGAFNWKNYKYLDHPSLYGLANFVDQGITHFSQKLAVAIINLTDKYQRYPGRKKYLVTLTEHALRLNCTDTTRLSLSKNLEILKQSAERTELLPRSSSIPRTIAVISVMIFIAFSVSRIINTRSEEQPLSSFMQTRPSPIHEGYDNEYDFSLKEFRAFHQKVLKDVEMGTYVKSQGKEVPHFQSPFHNFDEEKGELTTTNGMFINETEYDLLVIYYSKFGLRSFHIPPLGKSTHALSPEDEFFIYSGTHWKNTAGIEYSHFSSTQNRTYWMSIEGHFDDFNLDNLDFLFRTFSIPTENSVTKIITTISGEIVLGQGNF